MWTDVIGSAYYEVSDKGGKVRNKRTKHILSPTSNGFGILKVILAEDGENQSKAVARLVGECYVEGYEEGHVIFYKDDDKNNVDADNLLWVPRWFAQEWVYQSRRSRPLRPWPVRVVRTGEVFNNSLECAKATFCIEKYVMLACVQGNTIYNGSTYEWIKE